MSCWRLGFFGILLFYALGLGLVVTLAQFGPVADMCNPGVPVIAGLATLALGAFSFVCACVAVLFGYRTEFVKGFMAAHSLILVGLVGLILVLTGGA